MNSLPKPSGAHLVSELALDSGGCLYQPRVRRELERYGKDMEKRGGTEIAAIEAVAAMRLAGQVFHHLMERWAEQHGLSEGRLRLLFSLRLSPDGLPLGTLAHFHHVSPRNVTGLVDGLARDGLVERVPDPGDRRSILARLTPAGKARINAIWKQALAQHEPMVSGFTREELVQLRHMCLRIVRNLAEIGSV